MRKMMAHVVCFLLVAMGPAHARDQKDPPPPPDPVDLEVIAIMDILKLMDLAKEMEMVKDMEHLAEESKNERTTD